MECFDKLFTAFSIAVVVILLAITGVSACITIIDKGNSNIYSAEITEIQYHSHNFYVAEL